MKTVPLVSTLIALGVVIPAHATYALDMDELVQAAMDGNGTYVETHASASSGGQTSQGGTMQTSDVSASSYSEIITGTEGGEVNVKVETSENGETLAKEFTQEIPAGEGVKVQATAESTDGEAAIEVKVNDEVVETGAAATAAATTSAVADFFTETIPGFFKKVVGFFF